MKKFTNQGFLLVETLVVSTFCITVLVMLFLQFKTLTINYNNSYKYNTVEGIYKLNTIKKYLLQNNITFSETTFIYKEENYDDKCNEFCQKIIGNGNYKTVIYTNEEPKNIPDLSGAMKNFARNLKSSDTGNRLIAEFKDGTFASIMYQNLKLLYVSQSGNDTNNGTIDHPYLTIEKAYDKASTDQNINTKIYIMDDITLNEPITMYANKKITLSGCSKEENTCKPDITKKIIKNTSYSNNASGLINLNAGELTLENITIDGNNVSNEYGGIIVGNATLRINKNTKIQNFVSSNYYGGAIRTYDVTDNNSGSKIYLTGGQIINNKAPSGAGIHLGHFAEFNMQYGEISNNSSTGHGGGIYSSKAKINISGGNITNNQANNKAGGIFVSNETTLTMDGGQITNNNSTISGGIWLGSGCTFKMNDGVVHGGILQHENSVFEHIDGEYDWCRPENS